MKSSLLWRFAVIVAVIAAWTVSLFPLQDRGFRETFERMAEPHLEDLRKDRQKAESKLARLQTKLDEAGKGTPKAEKLEEKVAEVEAEAERLNTVVEQYDKLTERVKTFHAQHPNWAWYRIYKEAAKLDTGRRAIRLRNYVPVPLQPSASNNLVLSRVRNKASGKLRLGLDLRGGTEFIIGFNADDVGKEEDPERVRDQIITILRNRVDSLGVTEPEIKATGKTSVSLRMPSVSEDGKADIRRTIKQTAKLRFHLVHSDNDRLVREYRRNPEQFEPPLGYVKKEMEIERDGDIQTEILFIKSRPSDVRGGDVTRAAASFGQFGN